MADQINEETWERLYRHGCTKYTCDEVINDLLDRIEDRDIKEILDKDKASGLATGRTER